MDKQFEKMMDDHTRKCLEDGHDMGVGSSINLVQMLLSKAEATVAPTRAKSIIAGGMAQGAVNGLRMVIKELEGYRGDMAEKGSN